MLFFCLENPQEFSNSRFLEAPLTDSDGNNDVGVNVGVNENNLLELIVKDSNVSAQKASRILGVSKRQAERLFASLREKD